LTCPPSCPPPSDLLRVRHILDELVTNATASAEPGMLHLTVNCQSDPSDDCITVAVEDNGCGMTPDIQAKAFDPFFSHRPAGRARGLGLAKALRLAEGNMARLWLESEPGRGTKAYLRLPTHQATLPSHSTVL
jgi:two-component system NtrC family sensor kinase